MFLTMKIKITFLLSAICLLFFTVQLIAQQLSPASAQNANTTNKQSIEDAKNADLSITANVTARELKFEVVPNPRVEFTGKPERKTVWEADRRNLPRPVEPGVTYRNIGIELRISSRFADIERIVAEALGEIPITDAAPVNTNQPQNASSTPLNKTSEANNKNKKPQSSILQ